MTRMAAIGCFGGALALELARNGAALDAVVGFHSGLRTSQPGDASKIRGKVLVCIGADDPVIHHGQRQAFEQEMRTGGIDWRLHLYGGVVHSFTNPAATKIGKPVFASYDAGADRRSWAEMLALFGSVSAI